MSFKVSRRTMALVAGAFVSLFFLWVAVRDVSWVGLMEAFARIRWLPWLATTVSLCISIWLRAVRWRIISGDAPDMQERFGRATTLGVLSNMLLPGRAGEVVRVITLARLCGSSISRPLASAFIDRMVDMVVLLVSAGIFMLWLPVGALLGGWVKAFFAVTCLIAILLAIYLLGGGQVEIYLTGFLKRHLRKWPISFETFLAELRKELRRLLGGWLSLELFVMVVAVLAADCLVLAGLLWAFDLFLPLSAPLLLWVFFAIGAALPSAPGYVGVYQMAAVWAFSIYEAPAALAVATATVFQVTTLLAAAAMSLGYYLVDIRHRFSSSLE